MTSTVTGIIAWPVITLMVIVLAARLRWCKANLYDTYFNNVMAWLLLAQLLRERGVEGVLSRSALMTVTTAQQLSCVAMDLACVELIGFTRLWERRSPAEMRRSQCYYRLAAIVLSVAFLVAATIARVAGQTLEVSGGWDAILALGLYLTTIVVVLARFTWMFTSEMRKAADKREFLLALAGILFAFVTAAACLEAPTLAVTDQLGWTHSVELRLWLHGSEFFWQAVFVYILGAVPLAVRLHSYLGRDRVSRSWNSLQSLRLSMTTVVPQVRFNLEHDNGRFQKTALQLRPYVRNIAPHERARFLAAYSVPTREHGVAADALELAHAAKAKTAGAKPEPSCTALVVRGRTKSLDEEAADLLALAKWWTPACAAAEQFTPTAPEMKSTSLA